MSSEGTGRTIVHIKTGKRKVLITFDDNKTLLLSYDAFTDQPLYEGKECTDEEWKALTVLADEDKLRNIALRFVTKEPHTRHEVIQFLYKKGANEKTAYRIVAQLEDLKLINDEMYADIYAKDAAGIKLLGRNKILSNLKEKGIGDEILSRIHFDEERELSKARRYASMANKKFATSTNTKKMYKVIDALLRRGFDEDVAREAARLEFTAGDPELELQRLRKDAIRTRARFIKRFSGYELKRRVWAALARKGYPFESIDAVMKELEDEDF